jgi:hypothetical protein
MSRLSPRQGDGAASPLVWALAASLSAHATLLGWRALNPLTASALSRLEVRLEPWAGALVDEAGTARAAPPLASVEPEPRARTVRLAASTRPIEASPHGAKAASNFTAPSAAAAPEVALSRAAEPTAAPVPLESAGGRLVLPQGVRAVYRQVGNSGQRELIWRLDGGHYSLHWIERREDGSVTGRASARGVLSYAGLLPTSYQEVRAGHPERELRFDWAAGVVSHPGGDDPAAERLAAGDQDPISVVMQLAVVHQVVAEPLRRAGVRLGIAGGGQVSAHPAPAAVAAGRARYELAEAGAAVQFAAVELAAEHGFLPAQLEEVGSGGRTVWQLAVLEELDAD